MRRTFLLLACIMQLICNAQKDTLPFIRVLGVAQDGGYPHFGCEKKCCKMAWKDATKKRFVVALALVEPRSKKWWLMEATPDIKEQIEYFKTLTKGAYNYLPDGILITHAHIGHYAGLMQLGREVMNTSNIPVYVMPKMKTFIENNGPWSQLVKLNNIQLKEIDPNSELQLSSAIHIKPFTVPHRDEFSETVGFRINTSAKKYLFIPDIDKWQKWERSILEEVKRSDIAFIDATFNNINELKNRDIKEVPHPFVQETIELFSNEDDKIKSKVYFIHFNHTNSLLWDKASQSEIEKKKFHLAIQGNKY
ncbi:MAG: MBL fold metallo-hydrolase [Sphingobacteriaceae bacterium]|jgi:pyrroloquinoline quinone biosynthesis protein B